MPQPSTAKTPAAGLHLILDLGTTTLAGQLLTADGAILATTTMVNPQQAWGADILTRLERARLGDGKALQVALVEGLNTLGQNLLRSAGVPPGAVGTVVAAGNPGMTGLLVNHPVEHLLFPPHRAPFKDLRSCSVEEVDLGLEIPLRLFPSVSGFVGGDLVAVLLAVEDSPQFRLEPAPGEADVTLVIDIGTNAELALWDGQRWRVTSAAAGPAFEAGNIGTGMLLADGAVTDAVLDGDQLRLKIAGNGPPRGVCGSGLAALLAAALEGGLVDASGRIRSPDEVPTNAARYLVEQDGAFALCYHRSAAGALLLTQQDVRNTQFAKGAVRAGVEVLLAQAGLQPGQVGQVVVTGALGAALPGAALKRVALLPEPMVDKTSFVTNGVLTGLRSFVAAADGRQRLQRLQKTLQPFPLSGTPAFAKHFLAALDF